MLKHALNKQIVGSRQDCQENGISITPITRQITTVIGKKEEQEISYYYKLQKLSPQENKVLKLMSKPGMTFHRAARLMKVKRQVVQIYWRRIREKLEGSNGI